jgi:AraC family transcriptional regulator of arabinose operon
MTTIGSKITQLPITPERSLKSMVENRRIFSLQNCELNIFETFETANQIPLTFSDFVVTSMVRGKKVMHLLDQPAFDYLPGETVLVPAQHTMYIDFPEASFDAPTQCIAMALDQSKILQILARLNEEHPRPNGQVWQLDKSRYHFLNHEDLAQSINKLIRICSGNAPGKDVLADLALQEMVVHIVQTQQLHQAIAEPNGNDALSYVIGYIRANITEKIQIKQLTDKACMSRATFYRAFKKEFNISPLDFILQEKIKKAKHLLVDSKKSVSEICYELGFSDLNYFGRQFKKSEGLSPTQYRMTPPISDSHYC